ncbi:hypothetical protein [Halobellus rufus]|uniref:hypothetical protein n=1 Tax=Halobellus rufus TaxID=1448860 RepID=UPI0006784EF4|nr:hypothetical protein [Halobellus rufus]
MTPADLLSRLVGLAAGLAGVVLAWVGLFVPLAVVDGARGVDLLARGAVANVAVAGAVVGIGFLLAGSAVALDRGRTLAVSVGGVALAAVAALLAVGVDPGTVPPTAADGVGVFGALGVGTVALALVLAGARIGNRTV